MLAKLNKYMTIKQAAYNGIYPETALRNMLKEGRLPGVYSGTRYYIDVELLQEQLKQEALANASGRAAE